MVVAVVKYNFFSLRVFNYFVMSAVSMVSNLFYFVQSKAKVLPFINIVGICSDFYYWDEIGGTRNVLSENSITRLIKYKGPAEEKSKKFMIKMVQKVRGL